MRGRPSTFIGGNDAKLISVQKMVECIVLFHRYCQDYLITTAARSLIINC